jgi:hypothetical protein
MLSAIGACRTERVPGDGDIPLAQLLTWIARTDYSGVIDLELSGPRIAVAVASFAVLPLLSDEIPGGWRVVLGIGGMGLLTLPVVNRRDIVESPRWLVQKSRHDEAAVIVRRMQRRSGQECDESIPFDLPDTGADRERVVHPIIELLRSRRLLFRLGTLLGFWLLFYLASTGSTHKRGLSGSTSTRCLVGGRIARPREVAVQ